MTTTNNFSNASVHTVSLTKRMLQGAALGMVIVTLFLSDVNHTDPTWGKFWMVRPILILPMAGAGGGLFYYFMDHLRAKGGWKKAAAYIISFFGLIIALWLGTVLGFAGTLWN